MIFKTFKQGFLKTNKTKNKIEMLKRFMAEIFNHCF